MSALAKKYAGLIAKGDLEDVLALLPKEGGISGIAEKCNLTRRAVYQFDKREDIRLKTRISILDACLRTNPEQTLRFLVERSKEKSTSILMTYLSHLNKKVISTDTIKKFGVALRRFMKVRERHFGLISDEISDEVEAMTRTFDEKALEYEIELPLESLRTTSASHIIEVIPHIIDEIHSGGYFPEKIARTYRVPLELTRRLSSSFEIPYEKLEINKAEESKTTNMAATLVAFEFRVDRKTPEVKPQKLMIAAI